MKKRDKIIRITGGLGNQMFQYAFIYATAKLNNTDFVLDGSSYLTDQIMKGGFAHNGYELETFKIGKKMNVFSLVSFSALSFYSKLLLSKLKKVELQTSGQVCVERPEDYYSYHQHYQSPRYNYYQGFFQNEDYFKGYAEEIKNIFAFPDFEDDENIKIYNKIKTTNSVSLHVRRGDYLTSPGFHSFGPEYYTEAVRYISQRVDNPVFIVFSDDVEWCRENLELPNAIYVTNNSGSAAYRDMQLMSSCGHHIISNSSFSWWGAWLGDNKKEDKHIVCPANWHRQYPSAHPCPQSWVRL